MKRLGAILAGVILAIGLFGGFSAPQHVSAQSAQNNQTAKASEVALRNQLTQEGVAVFDRYIKNLETKQQNPTSIPSLKDASAQKITAYINGNKSLIFVIKNAQTNFINLIQSPIASSVNVYADFSAALTSAVNKLVEGAQGDSSINGSILMDDVKDLSKELNTLSEKKRMELIDTGKEKEALELGNATKAQQKAIADKEAEGKCSFIPANIGPCVSQGMAWFIKKTALEVAGWFLWLSANIFNYSVKIGILEFAKWAPDTLYPVWVVIRQIVSLFIVFVGLYLGFMYILGRGETFAKYMPWVIVFALFVNFSYPLARTAIDVSNIVSLKIYASAIGDDALSSNPSPESTAGGLIVARLGLYGLTSSATKVNSEGFLKGVNTISGAIAVVIFVLYAAYIFLIASGIMIMRTASLIFLTIASPLLLVDGVIPLLGDHAMTLRKLFLKQLIVAPVFMIMLAVTLKFLEVFSSGPLKNNTLDSVGGSGQDTIGIFFNIIMMLIMLHIMITVTKKIAGETGNFLGGALGKVGGFAGGAALGVATGGAGLLARGVIGRGAAGMLQPGGTMDKWQSKSGVTGAIGRRMYNFTDSIAKSSFDARNSSFVQAKASKLGLSGGMGAGVKGGYEERKEVKRAQLAKHLEKVGTYREDVYEKNEDGTVKLKHKKGDVANIDTRMAFAKNAAGQSNFGLGKFTVSGQEKTNITGQLSAAIKNDKQKKISDGLEEYKKLETDEEKKSYLANQKDQDVLDRIKKYDDKEAATKGEQEERKKKEDDFRAQTLQAQKDLAAAQKESVQVQREALQAQKGQATPSATPQGQAASPSFGTTVSSTATLNGSPAEPAIPNPKTTDMTAIFAKKKAQPPQEGNTPKTEEKSSPEVVTA